MEIRNRKLLYHQTKLDNLESIVTNGLLSRAFLRENNMAFQDVADAQILEGRHGLNLENYVPFHFHWDTTFDFVVRRDHPNDKFIYLCLQREKARALEAKILPAHPLSNVNAENNANAQAENNANAQAENNANAQAQNNGNAPMRIFDYDQGIEAIEWDVMEKDRRDVREEEYNRWKQIRMAECLIKNKVDINDILKIYTKSEEDADTVKSILTRHNRGWRYKDEQNQVDDDEHYIYIEVKPRLF